MPGQGIEVEVAARWLNARLRADTTLTGLTMASPAAGQPAAVNIHMNVLKGLPGVVYSFQGGNDVRAVGPIRVWSSQLWLIKAVTAGEAFGQAEAIAQRVDELLDSYVGEVAGGGWIGCTREAPSYLRQVDGDQAFQHLGGQYRLLAQN